MCSTGRQRKRGLLATDKTVTENHNEAKFSIVEPSHNEYIYKITPTGQGAGTLGQKRQKYSKSQRNREFTARLCLLVMPESLPIMAV